MSTIPVLILSGDNTEEFIRYFVIDKERVEKDRIYKIKNSKGSISFGGKSTYGTLIDFACQRYGWTVDYVVWGISYANLKILMADVITTIYLSEDEHKKLNVFDDSEVIHADDPGNRKLIRRMFSEQYVWEGYVEREGGKNKPEFIAPACSYLFFKKNFF